MIGVLCILIGLAILIWIGIPVIKRVISIYKWRKWQKEKYLIIAQRRKIWAEIGSAIDAHINKKPLSDKMKRAFMIWAAIAVGGVALYTMFKRRRR